MKKMTPILIVAIIIAVVIIIVALLTDETPELSENVDTTQMSDETSMLTENDTDLPLQQVTTTIPTTWHNTYDEGIKAEISYPKDWTYTPAPTQGFGGVVRVTGSVENEEVWIEIGSHSQTPKKDAESLREYEMRRNETPNDMISHRRFQINDREYYQQVIELQSGGPRSKTYGVYTIFELDNTVYFAEIYTNNPNNKEEFFNQLLTSIN